MFGRISRTESEDSADLENGESREYWIQCVFKRHLVIIRVRVRGQSKSLCGP